MNYRTAVAVLCFAVFVGYVFYTPVPESMVDRWQYVFGTVAFKITTILGTLRTFVQPGDDVYYRTMRTLMDLPMRSPESQVQGSNIEAHYTEFDGIPVLLYEPLEQQKKGLLPAFVYMHGGGYTIGSTRLYGPLTGQLALELDMVVVSIEYRLAPEHPFPTAFEDCLKATTWFLKHAREFGVDAKRVVVGGDSAGGYLTALLTQFIHDEPATPDIKLQVLLYPWMQCFDYNTPSHQRYEKHFGATGLVARPRLAEFTSAYFFGRFDYHFMSQLEKNGHTSADFKRSNLYRSALNNSMILEKLGTTEEYLPQESFLQSNDTLWANIKGMFLDPRAAPLFRQDFKGLPKAFIATVELDSLRDDGMLYAHKLEEAGVKVKWVDYKGVYHAVLAEGPITNIPSRNKILQDVIQFVKENI